MTVVPATGPDDRSATGHLIAFEGLDQSGRFDDEAMERTIEAIAAIDGVVMDLALRDIDVALSDWAQGLALPCNKTSSGGALPAAGQDTQSE